MFLTDLEINGEASASKLNNISLEKIDNISKKLLNCLNSGKEINLLSKNLRNECNDIFLGLERQVKSNDELFALFIKELSNKVDKYIIDLTMYLVSTNKKYNENKSELYNKGYYFGKLNKNITDQILDISKNEIIFFRNNIIRNKLSREDLSINTGKTMKEISYIINNEFDKLGIIEDVSNFMKKEYLVTGIALEMSTPKSTWWRKKENNKKIPKTLYAHIDESPIYPKSILYLSDVNENNGPTSFYPNIKKKLELNFLQDVVGRVINGVGLDKNSKLSGKYRRDVEQRLECNLYKSHVYKLPNNLRFYSHFGWYVKPDSNLENAMINDEKKMIGEKGSFVIFDGAQVLHRGGLIQDHERIVLQIIFGPKESFYKKALRKLNNYIS